MSFAWPRYPLNRDHTPSRTDRSRVLQYDPYTAAWIGGGQSVSGVSSCARSMAGRTSTRRGCAKHRMRRRNNSVSAPSNRRTGCAHPDRGANLAIEDRIIRQSAGEVGQQVIKPFERVCVSRNERARAALDDGDCPPAINLQFKKSSELNGCARQESRMGRR